LPCRYGATPDHRIQVELVEADIEIGFRLVDSVQSRPADVVRLLSDAEGVYRDALTRIERLEPPERASFQPLIAELRRAIDLAAGPAG